jgi:hypothetical protein
MKGRRPWLKILMLLSLGAAAFLVGLYFYLRPAPLERTEIFQGVYLTVLDYPKSADGGGRVMIVEVHWDTPGVRLQHRPYDYAFSPDDPTSPHYNLAFADWALMRHRPAILVNTTRYSPSGYLDSLPGMAVRTHETLVVDGHPSHIHEHSYLMYWDADGEAHMQTSKPPSQQSLDAAVLGIGMQGIQIAQGRAQINAVATHGMAYSRTFIGCDPTSKILYLMAFESATPRRMLSVARDAGVVYGGMVDSGDGTSLLVGPDAKNVRSHSGIRNRRPLGPYLMVHANGVGANGVGPP